MYAYLKRHNLLFDLLVLAVITALSFGLLLGERPYSAPSESRYIEIGREMAESGDYITPRLNYVKYFEKPPLFYWMQALWTEVAGVDFFHARVPTAFFSVLLCLLTYGLGRMLYGRQAGVLSALVISTSVYLFALSRVVLLDVPVSVFLVATMMAFLYAINAPPGRKRTLAIYGIYIAAAGSVMTKGLIGIVLPGAVFFLWFLFTRRWKLLLEMRLVTGTLLFLALTAPWHIAVWQANPEHPWFYFVHEHWLRYTTKVHERHHPWWFFGAVLLAGLLPWLMFAPQALKSHLQGFWQERKSDGIKLFLVLWVVFIFLFFSTSDSKLIPYILPIFPPLCAVLGGYFSRLWRVESMPGFRSGVYIMIAFMLALAFLPGLIEDSVDKDSKIYQAIDQGEYYIRYLSAAALVSAIAIFLTYFQGSHRHVIISMIASAVVIIQLSETVASSYSKDSMQTIAASLQPILKPEDDVAVYEHYYQDLPVYLKRRITIVSWKGELDFGSRQEDTSAWLLEDDAFWKRWETKDQRVFVITRKDALERIQQRPHLRYKKLHLLMQAGRNLLFSNVPKESLFERK